MIHDPALGLFVVCDGMGGHAGGDVAAQVACARIHHEVATRYALLRAAAEGRTDAPVVREVLRAALSHASLDVHARSRRDRRLRGMGTTATLVLVLGGRAYVTHVGDSRAYLCRAGEVQTLTHDHTLGAEALRRQLMTPAQVAQNPYRALLTRFLGQAGPLVPDDVDIELRPDDVLVVCSDGVHHSISDAATLASMAASSESAGTLASRLVRWAVLGEERDDASAVFVRIHPETKVASVRRRDRVEALVREAALFRDLTPDELRCLAEVSDVVEAARDAVVAREGDPSETLYIVIDGELKLVSGERTVATAAPGAQVGEMALFGVARQRVSLVARTPATLLAVDATELRRSFARDPSLAAKLLWHLGRALSYRLEATGSPLRDVDPRRTLVLGSLPAPRATSR